MFVGGDLGGGGGAVCVAISKRFGCSSAYGGWTYSIVQSSGTYSIGNVGVGPSLHQCPHHLRQPQDSRPVKGRPELQVNRVDVTPHAATEGRPTLQERK